MSNLSKLEKLTSYSKELFADSSSLSIMLVGSIARDEPLRNGSDIDLIIFIDDDFVDLKYFGLINRFGLYVGKMFHRPVSLQIITPYDLEMIMAPTLLPSYINDGVMIWGADIKGRFHEQLEKYTPEERKFASFKRILFERHYFRMTLAKLEFSKKSRVTGEEILLSKRTMFIVKELSNIFSATPESALELMGLHDTHLKFPVLPRDFKSEESAGAINRFVDQSVLILRDYLKKKGVIKLDVW